MKKQNLFFRSFVFFVATFFILKIVDNKTALSYRLNSLLPAAETPIVYSRDNVSSFHPEALRDSLRYYKILNDFIPNSPQPLAMVGLCYYYLEEIPKSEQALKRAKKISPSAFWLSYNLGILALQHGDKTKAQKLFQEVLEMSPNDMLAAAVLADPTHLEKGKRDTLYAMAIIFVSETRQKCERWLSELSTSPTQEWTNDSLKMIVHPWVYMIPVGREFFFARSAN